MNGGLKFEVQLNLPSPELSVKFGVVQDTDLDDLLVNTSMTSGHPEVTRGFSMSVQEKKKNFDIWPFLAKVKSKKNSLFIKCILIDFC